MSKHLPRKYGDKVTQELVGAGGGPIQTKSTIDPGEAYRRMLKRR